MPNHTPSLPLFAIRKCLSLQVVRDGNGKGKDQSILAAEDS